LLLWLTTALVLRIMAALGYDVKESAMLRVMIFNPVFWASAFIFYKIIKGKSKGGDIETKR